MDKYIMDGCKLTWHPDRVAAWRREECIVPIHIDVGMSKGCNIRCEYCFGVLQGNFYKRGATRYFKRNALLRYMREAGELGVRSMGFIGEGEPTLNPHLPNAIVVAKNAGIDVSLGTNGILFPQDVVGESMLECLSWIRFNISAADDIGYRKIHGSKKWGDFLSAVKFCVATKYRKNLPVTIGFQSVLTPNNAPQMVHLARLGKKLGVDYHVIKQCSDTVESDLGIYNRFDEYPSFREILQAAEAETEDNYNVIVKWKMIGNDGTRDYERCLGAPFLLYSSGDGRLYPCGAFFDGPMEAEFRMGDLNEKGFKEIWESERYWEVVEKVAQLDISNCYSNCRSHYINDYLWRIIHPPEHVNFV